MNMEFVIFISYLKKINIKLFFFLAIFITLSNCTVSNTAQQNKETSNIVLDTLYETLAYRNTNFNHYIDSCMVYSYYLEIHATHNARKIIYRDLKAMVKTTMSGKSDTLTAKVCFDPKGIAVQVFKIKSTFTDTVSKKLLQGLMKYKAEPLLNPNLACPDCSLFNIRSSGVTTQK